MANQTTHSRMLTRRVAVAGAGLLTLRASLGHLPSRASAHQDGQPLAGTTIEVLAGGEPTLAPDTSLALLRITMEPGTVIPAHSHPGPVALYVEQGLFGTEFIEGTGTLQPVAVAVTPTAAIPLAAGDDAQMPAGDRLFYEGAVHTMRNDGDEPVVLMVAALFERGADGFSWQDQATP